MIIHPLAITTPHWPTFISVTKDNLGESPTRGLDQIGLDINSCAAFLGCIDFNNNVKNQLRGSGGRASWKHVSCSFIFVAKSSTVLQLLFTTNLKITGAKKEVDGDEFLCIATGDMLEWRDAVIICCSDRYKKEVREFANYVLVYLQESGFRDVWHDCEKIDYKDGTFLIRRK